MRSKDALHRRLILVKEITNNWDSKELFEHELRVGVTDISREGIPEGGGSD